MKTAKLTPVQLYHLDCPECGEGIDNPVDGSQSWGLDAEEIQPGQITVECTACDAVLRLPAKLRRSAA